MSSYKAMNLFASGPHRFVVHGRSQRHVVHEAPDADGAAITTLGLAGRRIDQFGSLAADDLAGLQAQLDAIEAAMDGEAGDLVDDLGRTHGNVLLLQFAPGEIGRLGPRLVVDYTARYAQAAS